MLYRIYVSYYVIRIANTAKVTLEYSPPMQRWHQRGRDRRRAGERLPPFQKNYLPGRCMGRPITCPSYVLLERSYWTRTTEASVLNFTACVLAWRPMSVTTIKFTELTNLQRSRQILGPYFQCPNTEMLSASGDFAPVPSPRALPRIDPGEGLSRRVWRG